MSIKEEDDLDDELEEDFLPHRDHSSDEDDDDAEPDDDDDDDDEEIEEEDVVDMWIARNNSDAPCTQLEILTYENKLNCTSRRAMNVAEHPIEAMCLYNSCQMWCVDANKCIHVYW